jgi:ABC-2 type transport system ATP-binding protein
MSDNGVTAAIRCAGLSKRYGEVQALQGLDLVVPAGSVFGFLGRNGAGKTTTIRLLTGLAHPDSGAAWIAGMETTNGNREAQASFGYLPQEPAFYGWMTPPEYLDYCGRLFLMATADRRQRTAELLSLVGLEGAAKRRIAGFSGGMKQRLGLAQALMHRPPVLILDEPTSGLDPAGRRDVLQLMESLRGQTTVFFSSHILADVERICDTVGILHEGRLLMVAGRGELLARYESHVALLDVERASLSHLPGFAAELEQQDWVERVTVEDNRIRVVARDMAAGRRFLLPLVVAHALELNRYEWVRPSLEEIFLDVSESGL